MPPSPSGQTENIICPRGVLVRQPQRLVGVKSPLECLWALRHEQWAHLGPAVLWLGQQRRLQHLAGVESPLSCLWASKHERWAHLGGGHCCGRDKGGGSCNIWLAWKVPVAAFGP